jgi:DNA-binding MarR family transcriptional regulator
MHVTVERLFRLLKAQMSATLEECGSSIVEWRILLMLRIHGEMAQKDLVREVAMVQAQVSRSLSAMERRGLVYSRQSRADRRVWLFNLTPAGSALYRQIAPAMERRKQLLDSTLTAGECQAFLDGARKIAAAARLHVPEQETAA